MVHRSFDNLLDAEQTRGHYLARGWHVDPITSHRYDGGTMYLFTAYEPVGIES